MLQPLLIEIGVEELPAIPFLKELPNIEKKWNDILEKNALLGEFEFYYTPRRLVIWHKEFASSQADNIEEMFGAPVSVAFKDGVATPAANGFAKKCGVPLDDIGRTQKGSKEVLYYKKELKGKESKKLLNDIVNEWIKSLSFGKAMRWASNNESFIRPIRWINIMLDDELVDVEVVGVKSKKATFVHRISNFNELELSGVKEYFEVLKEGGVTLFQDERRKKILKDFSTLESK